MTKEEAIDVFKNCIEKNDRMTFCINNNSPLYNACMVAIRELKQEPCEDFISREVLIDRLLEKVKTQRSTIEIVDKLIPLIKDLPSVIPARAESENK